LSRLAECPWPDPSAPADDRRFLVLDALAQSAARVAAFSCLGLRSWWRDRDGRARVHCGQTHDWARAQARWEARRRQWVAESVLDPAARSLACRPFVRRGQVTCQRWWCPYCRYRQTHQLTWRFLLGAEDARRRRKRKHARLMLVRLEATSAPLNHNSFGPEYEQDIRRAWGEAGWLLRPTAADLDAGWIFGGPRGRRRNEPGSRYVTGHSAVPDAALPGRPVARLSVFQPIRMRMPKCGGSNTGPLDRSDWDFVWGVRESVVALCWVTPPGSRRPGRPGRRRGEVGGPGLLGRPLTAASPARVFVSPRGVVAPVGRFAPAVRPYTPRALAAALGQALRLPGWVGRGPTADLYLQILPTGGTSPLRVPVRRVMPKGRAVGSRGAAARLADQTPGTGDARWRTRLAADPAAFGRLLCRQAVAAATAALDGLPPGGVELPASAARRLVRLRTQAGRLGEGLRLAPGRVAGPDRAVAALRLALQARRLRARVLALASPSGPRRRVAVSAVPG
jgi:hypothetical protein